MRKWTIRMMVIIGLVALLAGCGAGEENTEETDSANDDATVTDQAESETAAEDAEITVSVTISENDGEEIITEEEVTTEEGAILLDVMEENFDVEHDAGFITSINGIAPEEGEQRAWMYFVNDEMPNVGAGEYELQADDSVVFDLQAWE
ncbi:DUF4430 domain-containing protein [Oceanobacillus piezotolerans]|nr:DUF4430 domain-containing protein [Oceanobacillus piezotolerans]